MLLYKILAFALHGKISYKNNKCEILAPKWREEFELSDRSYAASDVQDYFEYIFKKHGGKTDNPLIKIYVNNTELNL